MGETEDIPGQLHLFPSLSGRSWSVSIELDIPQSTDPALVARLDKAKGRLKRGAVVGKQKLRKLAAQLETMAGLFDGV